MKAPLPHNEAARAQALREYAILDTLEEQSYNDITMLASFICHAPIALISLVDQDRQWFKSRVGLQTAETPREHAFCAHAILEPQDVLVINDATLDPRFVDNPLVVGDPHIRFYAGAPLVTPAGDALGTICVIDRAPRKLAKNKVKALLALSRQVVTQLELRRVAAELNSQSHAILAYQRQLEAYQREIENINSALKSESTTDSLTGIRNRRAFENALSDELARTSREKTCVSLLFIDIDKFKLFNDQFGHLAGDDVLRQVARALSCHARPSDLVARVGGEEFVVVLPRTAPDEALAIGERLRRSIETARWRSRPITISLGVSTSDGNMDGKALLDRADQALYRMKKCGGNKVAHANSYS